ncbi:MAG: hypothetical protein ACTHOE_03200 [Conexibacter sp.]
MLSCRRLLAGLAVAAVAAGSLAPVARGDADPASDVLPYQPVFYPYRPAVSATLKARLDALTARAAKRRFPVKVAIIASQYDLGAVSSYFFDPRGYARFLEHEIAMNGPLPLIVVMPKGLATAAMPTRVAQRVEDQAPDLTGAQTDELTRTAIRSVRAILAMPALPSVEAAPPPSGHAAPPASSGRRASGGSSSLLLVFAPLGLLALAALARTLHRRARRAR